MSRVILGLDPGLATTGFGVLLAQSRDDASVIEYGIIKTKADDVTALRLQQIHDGLVELIKRHKPSIISIEKLFFGKNAKTAMLVGQARGVLLLVAQLHNISIVEYTPLQVKIALSGYGRADKRQMQLLVQQQLRLKKVPTPDDAADALAIALTAILSLPFEREEKI